MTRRRKDLAKAQQAAKLNLQQVMSSRNGEVRMADSGALPHYALPRAANIDPMSSAWLQSYTTLPNDVHLGTGVFTYTMLRMMSYTPWVAIIHGTRMNQGAEFAEPVEDEYSLGYDVVAPTSGALTRKDRIARGEIFSLMNTAGGPWFPGGFPAFLRCLIYNTYTFDQVNVEKLIDHATGKPWAFVPVDPTTIRRQAPSLEELKSLRWDFSKAGYVQRINARIVREFSPTEMSMWIRNREDNIYRLGYGAPELEKASTILYAMITSVIHNIVAYTTGMHSQNVVEAGLVGADERMATFERTLASATSGLRNSRRTPIIQTNPALQEYLKIHQLTHPNKDMEYTEWMNQLIKWLYAIHQMDPAESSIIFGNEGQKQQMNQTQPSERIMASKERGFRPLMKVIQRWINEFLIEPHWPGYKFVFRGFDAMTRDKKLELDLKAATAYLSPNELRLERGLEPWDDPVSNRPLNALYTAYIQHELDKQDGSAGVDDPKQLVGI